MPKNVVCKKCNNLVNDWCEKVIDSPDQDMQRDCQQFREKTNADRIRSMSDEELADFLAYTWATSSRAWQKDTGETLHWLKQHVEGE